jgi:hypothetical protein
MSVGSLRKTLDRDKRAELASVFRRKLIEPHHHKNLRFTLLEYSLPEVLAPSPEGGCGSSPHQPSSGYAVCSSPYNGRAHDNGKQVTSSAITEHPPIACRTKPGERTLVVEAAQIQLPAKPAVIARATLVAATRSMTSPVFATFPDHNARAHAVRGRDVRNGFTCVHRRLRRLPSVVAGAGFGSGTVWIRVALP